MTAVREYLRGLAAAMTERGYRGRLFVMQSSGGVATAEAMQRYPVRMIESGPAAGALMAGVYGELDRKSTRLNSSHGSISYAVFCLKKKNKCAHLLHDHQARGFPRDIDDQRKVLRDVDPDRVQKDIAH